MIEKLDKGCAAILPSNHSLEKVCEMAAKDIVDLLPTIDKQIDSLAWDNKAICAGLGLCTVPCCHTRSKPEQVHFCDAIYPSP